MPGALGFSPFELLYGRPPPPHLGKLPGDLHQIGDKGIREQLQTLGAVLNKLQRYTIERGRMSLGTHVHLFQPGDCVGQRLEEGTS